MSIVVTAASGQLGRLTVDALLRRGVPAADIVATGRDITKITTLAERGVVVRQADFADPHSLAAADADLGLSRGELFTGSRDLSHLIGRPTTSLTDAIADASR